MTSYIARVLYIKFGNSFVIYLQLTFVIYVSFHFFWSRPIILLSYSIVKLFRISSNQISCHMQIILIFKFWDYENAILVLHLRKCDDDVQSLNMFDHNLRILQYTIIR